MHVYDYEHFSRLRNTQLTLSDSQENQIDVTVIDVLENKVNEAYDAFSVTLQTQQPLTCPQGIYQLSGPTFGDKEFFLVPIAPNQLHLVISHARITEAV
ncbi:DUF6916 family protein [Ferrimonas pelagia]|uniref:DUF6916 domain-containing protein n=1 Tax=Ferrimonas pelagia TaxID=1177826 RepID=A0ABP9EC69_9GAMM